MMVLPVLPDAWAKAGVQPHVYPDDHPVTRRLRDANDVLARSRRRGTGTRGGARRTERMLYSTDYPYTFGTRPGGFPCLDTSGGVARSFLPFSEEEKAAIGSGNWERLTGLLAANH
ncbi:hypothetical protein [Amycolatopsis echigonensis]|uniref:hypothetical protein n=1 Tax=Amycolatopsis echigonensis TaxID=2576905 RepID=UPI001FE68CB8|nr:hypothetical protein [Amycolatopsis echigonensis]